MTATTLRLVSAPAAPPLLALAARELARTYPELYTAASPIGRREWCARVAEQLAFWHDAADRGVATEGGGGGWGVPYGDAIVAHWGADGRLRGWCFAHEGHRPVVPQACDARRGIFVDVPPVDWLARQEIATS